MSEVVRANCPLTDLHCEGRQSLIEMQTRLSVEAATIQPNIIADGDGIALRVMKHAANIVSSGVVQQSRRGKQEFSDAIDKALDANPTMECNGSLCGTLGGLVLAYGETFIPKSHKIELGKKE
ncbi:MAG TPA: hypothetical protein VLA92_00290 [Candidatus Saccharimonadales bacterium]|nr:hypothetical protein [Candidatus Saccharimonadales bacterium]